MILISLNMLFVGMPTNGFAKQAIVGEVDFKTAMRVQKILVVEAVRSIGSRLGEHFPTRLVRPRIQEPATSELEIQIRRQIQGLAGSNRELTDEDLGPVWQKIMQIHQRNEDNYDRLITIYEAMSELRLPPKDKLETIRLLGQHQYMLGNYSRAVAVFDDADEIDIDSTSADNRYICNDALANILYLRGLALSKDGQHDESINNYVRIVESESLLKHSESVTQLSIFLHLGQVSYDRDDFGDSTDWFRRGIAVLDDAKELEHRFRIRLVLGEAQASVKIGSEDESQINNDLYEKLGELKTKYSNIRYPDFPDLLKMRAAISKDIKEGIHFADDVAELRNYYKKKYEFTNEWESNEEDGFLESSSLLIKHYLEDNHREKAKDIIRDTKEHVLRVPAAWLNRFPKDFVQEALEKSVIDR